jgi:hypothetical protein
MKVDKAFPGNWLKASDLGDTDHTVTIESVQTQMIGQGEQAKLKLVLKFREFPKPLVCNLTNARAIAKLYGDETDEWIGKRVTLWVNPDVQFGSEIVEAIRIRSKVPTVSDGLLKWSEAIALCAQIGINEPELRQYLKSEGFNAYNAGTCSEAVRKLVAGFEPAIPQSDTDDIPF